MLCFDGFFFIKVTQINYVSRNQLHSTEFLFSTFEFERQNIAGWCKQTFCFQFSKTWFFQFLLVAYWIGRKNSNFFWKAVEWSDSMKRNYGGFPFTYFLDRKIANWFRPEESMRLFCEIIFIITPKFNFFIFTFQICHGQVHSICIEGNCSRSSQRYLGRYWRSRRSQTRASRTGSGM